MHYLDAKTWSKKRQLYYKRGRIAYSFIIRFYMQFFLLIDIVVSVVQFLYGSISPTLWLT